MKKLCEVVMLSTKKAGRIINKELQHAHLYILSPDNIKLNDWYYCRSARTDEYGISKADTDRLVKLCNESSNMIAKIIACTNADLELPRLSSEFIEAYCKSDGIKEIMVEYYISVETGTNLKVASDNTITITRVKPQRVIYSKIDMERAWHASKMSVIIDFDEWLKSYNN